MSVPSRTADLVLETAIVPSFTAVGVEVRRRLDRWTPLDDLDMHGRTVLVTGATSGLGQHTATRLADLGAQVILLARDPDKAARVRAAIAENVGEDRTEVVIADLTDLRATRRAADAILDRFDRLDVLVHNAGAMFDERALTGDGIERTVALHIVAPFLLTSRLLPLLRAAQGRVVTVSSGGMYTTGVTVDRLQSPDDYRPSLAYARAKRAQVTLTREWARRVPDVSFHAMHPGWVDTPGVQESLPRFRQLTRPLLRDLEQGADTIVWLAATGDLSAPSGTFWHDRRPRSPHKLPWTVPDAATVTALWDEVARLAGLPYQRTSPARTRNAIAKSSAVV